MITYESLTKNEKKAFDFFFSDLKEKLISLLGKKKSNKINWDKLKTDHLQDWQNRNGVVYNNVQETYSDATVADIVVYNKILPEDKRLIITGFNTLFYNRNKKENLPGMFLEFLLKARKVTKKEMLQHINDVDKSLYNFLDIKQLIFKILANSYYGAFGASSFIFFNPDLGPSITYTGQQIIISAILGFEAFMSGNFTFDTEHELTQYMYNICNLEEDPEFTLNDDLTSNDVVEYLLSKCTFLVTDEIKNMITKVVKVQTASVREMLYYKNNLMEFLKIPSIEEFVTSNLIVENYFNFEHPPEEIKENLKELNDLMKSFVFYSYPFSNKTIKVKAMMRKTVLLSDTDSTFLYIRPFIEYICNSTGEDPDKLTKEKRVSIGAVITYFITNFIGDVFYKLTKAAGVLPVDRPRVNMKSEFHYKRIMLTPNKKTYTGIVLAKEGNVYDNPDFDMKGLQIRKTSTPKKAREFYSHELEHNILLSEKIKPFTVFKNFKNFEYSVIESIRSGNTEYLKPGVIKNISSYKDKYSMQPFRAMAVWNAIFPKDTIPENSSMKILEFKKVGFENIKNYLPEEYYNKLLELQAEHPEMIERFGVDVMAIPFGREDFPVEFAELADIESITNGIIKKGNIILESVGFSLIQFDGEKRKAVSNILPV